MVMMALQPIVWPVRISKIFIRDYGLWAMDYGLQTAAIKSKLSIKH